MERWRILHKETDYTVIDNGIFKDSDLTLAERGFLCTVMSLPENWNFSTSGMAEIVPECRDTIYTVIDRLIEHGYCKRAQNKDKKTGKFLGYDYTFYEVKNGQGCASAPFRKIPYTDIPDTESPYTDNPTQSNTIRDKVPKESSTHTKKDIYISKEKFNFLNSLMALGVSEKHASEWMQVRRTKRLTNTETAFARIKAEILKSGRSAEDCIRTAVENSWGGFKAEWMPKPTPKYEYFGDIEGYIKAKNNGTLAQ